MHPAYAEGTFPQVVTEISGIYGARLGTCRRLVYEKLYFTRMAKRTPLE